MNNKIKILIVSLIVTPIFFFGFQYAKESSITCELGLNSSRLRQTSFEGNTDLEVLWSYQVALGDAYQEPPILITNDKVIVSHQDCNQVVAINSNSGNIDWKTSIVGASRIVYDNLSDNIYVYSFGTSRSLIALKRQDGEIIWKNSTRSHLRDYLLPHVFSNGSIFVETRESIFEVSSRSGEFVKEFNIPSNLVRDNVFVYENRQWGIEEDSYLGKSFVNDVSDIRLITDNIQCCINDVFETEDTLMIELSTGDIIGFDKMSNQQIWEINDISPTSNFVVSDTNVLFIESNDFLSVLESMSGTLLQQIDLSFLNVPESTKYWIAYNSRQNIVIYIEDADILVSLKLNLS